MSQIDRILEDISLQMNEENEQFSETVRKMLEIMEYDTPYTRKTLMEKLGLKSRDGFRRNYLQPALEMNLIQMTLPDKPNSRNQRYIKIQRAGRKNKKEFTGVYHKTSEQMSYPLDEDRLIVNIKSGFDVKQEFIHYGDPYEAGMLGGNEKWTGKREEIIYK